MKTVTDFIPEDGRSFRSSLLVLHGHKVIVKVVDGTRYCFPSNTHRNVHRWAILEDGSVIGFKESPRSGWSFPRIGKRAVETFYSKYNVKRPNGL